MYSACMSLYYINLLNHFKHLKHPIISGFGTRVPASEVEERKNSKDRSSPGKTEYIVPSQDSISQVLSKDNLRLVARQKKPSALQET